jgi:hypothetical protein
MIRDPRRPSRDKGVEFESMLEMNWLLVTDLFNRDLVEIEAQPNGGSGFRISECPSPPTRAPRWSKGRRSTLSIRRTTLKLIGISSEANPIERPEMVRTA